MTSKIAALKMVVREGVELPAGLKLETETFREGWNFVGSGDSKKLKKKIQTRGWNFIQIENGLLRSGVGDTSQEAISSALKLALRRIGEAFNAVEVEQIELTQYPWFFLARVRVRPYRIQPSSELSDMHRSESLQFEAPRRQSRGHATAANPCFAAAMPHLKEMLIVAPDLKA